MTLPSYPQPTSNSTQTADTRHIADTRYVSIDQEMKYSLMAVVITFKYPENVLELFAYQASIVWAERNVDNLRKTKVDFFFHSLLPLSIQECMEFISTCPHKVLLCTHVIVCSLMPWFCFAAVTNSLWFCHQVCVFLWCCFVTATCSFWLCLSLVLYRFYYLKFSSVSYVGHVGPVTCSYLHLVWCS